MNHNEDIAFNSIKIISKTDSYNNNSGALIINGGIGCKNTIHCKNLCADEGCFKILHAGLLSATLCDKISIKDLDVTNLIATNCKLDEVNINNLSVTKCIFTELIPFDETSNIGNEDNKVNIIGNNIQTDEITTNILNVIKLKISDSLYTHTAEIDNINASNIISNTIDFENGKFNSLLPINENSQIGNDENRPQIYSDNIDAYSGKFKTIIETQKLTAGDAKIEILKSNNVEINNLELDYGIYNILLPEDKNSQIGNEKNRATIYGKKIDTTTLISTNIENSNHIYSLTGKIDTLESNNVEIKNLDVDDSIYGNLLPKNEISQIGNDDNRATIYGKKIDTTTLISTNIENSHNIYSLTGKIDTLESTNVEIKNLDVDDSIYGNLLPKNEISQIGNEDNRATIYGKNIRYNDFDFVKYRK